MIATKTWGIVSFVVAGGIAITLFAVSGDSRAKLEARAVAPPMVAPATEQPVRCGPEWIPKSRVVQAAADDQLAEYLALTPPVGMSFDPNPANKARKAASLEHFNNWVQAKTKLGGQLQARYGASLAEDDASSVVAASRLGLVSKSFADALMTMTIPEDVRTGEFADEKVEAFCDKMMEIAEPLEMRALEAYGACVTRARTLSETARPDELRLLVNAAQPCLVELAHMKPDEYPHVDEVFTTSELVRLRIELGNATPAMVGNVIEYERENALGVVLRTKRDFKGARTAYRRAIALDQTRPDAHYNLGLLSTHEATTQTPEASIPTYEEANRYFASAAERATGTLRDEALEQVRLTEKFVQQTRAYLAGSK